MQYVPKRPVSSAFIKWLNTEGRALILKENPKIQILEVLTVAAKKWKALDKTKRQK
jgi:hypothetical protein